MTEYGAEVLLSVPVYRTSWKQDDFQESVHRLLRYALAQKGAVNNVEFDAPVYMSSYIDDAGLAIPPMYAVVGRAED